MKILIPLMLLSSTVFADDTGISDYIKKIPTFGVQEDVVETGWYKINERRWNDLTDPTKKVENIALTAIKRKLRQEGKSAIDSTITYSRIDKCEKTRDYQKYYFRQESSSSSSSSSFLITNDFIAQAGSSSSSYYLYHKSIRETYCADDATYLKASVKMTTRLTSADKDLKYYYVTQHIKRTTQNLTETIRELQAGLSEIEKNPIIDPSRYAKFRITSGMEMSAWMNFYFSQLRVSLAYVGFVKSLSLGFDVETVIDGLQQQAIGALRKFKQFESPAIYVVQIDQDNSGAPSVSPLFDLSAVTDLTSKYAIAISTDPGLVIANRSRVMDKNYIGRLSASQKCRSQFAEIKSKASTADVVDGSSNFITEAHGLLRNCASLFYVNEVSANDWSNVDYNGTSATTCDGVKKNVAKLITAKAAPLAKDCIPFQITSTCGQSAYSEYLNAKVVSKLKLLCPRVKD
jgi:hypothetical protein